ncbi:MAG TPA: hypothetical protein ENK44_09950 [Caldithrix abyssi]|uniref:Water stress and hypersensitive response domain-containing protein n=1 Tax=Caldithrix abyssi TaxID=187145 RepID=A0A7V4WVA4_CALAY|nr:hypothetical protein [Caldithrix abyssi]
MQITFKLRYFNTVLILSVVALLAFSCTQMQQLLKAVDIKNPQAKISNVKITDLSIEKADLVFDIAVSNPNRVGITLAGFDYDLLLNNQSFLKGNRNETLKIAAQGTSSVQLPLSLNFTDIYKTYKALAKEDNITYALKTGLNFDLPVLGKVRVPVETKGSVPTIKLPGVKLQALKLKNLGFTGADLQLVLQIDNPNGFDVNLNRFKYDFRVAGQKWVQGQIKKPTSVPQKGKATLSVPIALNFLEIGKSALNLINNGNKLNYRLSGGAEVGSPLPILRNFPLDFNYEGKIDLTK